MRRALAAVVLIAACACGSQPQAVASPLASMPAGSHAGSSTGDAVVTVWRMNVAAAAGATGPNWPAGAGIAGMVPAATCLQSAPSQAHMALLQLVYSSPHMTTSCSGGKYAM